MPAAQRVTVAAVVVKAAAADSFPLGSRRVVGFGNQVPRWRRQLSRKVSSMSATKSEIIAQVAEYTGVDKKTVAAVLAGLAVVAGSELQTAGEVMIPGLAKFKSKVVPARATRVGVNPFTGKEQTFHSKPASLRVRSIPVKSIKDLLK
jgi:nucleoid DNA-binding protein